MPNIPVIVRNKIATLGTDTFAVCGNSDYVIEFDFDSEWNTYEAKTARFKYNGVYTDVPFTGTKCPMPIINDTIMTYIGVYAGDLRTTTSAILPMRRSILCGSDVESEVSQEIKNNISGILNEKITRPQTAVVGEVLTVEEVDENGKPTKWKTAPAAAEQVQSDWGQNDETAADFVKNRPGGYTALEPAITGEYTGEELNMGEFTLIRDREYIVKIDDTEYKVTAKYIQVGRYDFALALGEWDFTNYPFYILINGNKDILTGDLIAKLKSTITTATITIIDNVVHQFDIKYIPDIPAEKIYPSPTDGFVLIDTVNLTKSSTQIIYLYPYKEYRIIIGYGIVRTVTSPSRVKIQYCKEPEEGGELRYNTYKYIRFIGHRQIHPNNPDNKYFFLTVSRLWIYDGYGNPDYEYYNQDMHFHNNSGIHFNSLNDSALEATTFYIYGMN